MPRPSALGRRTVESVVAIGRHLTDAKKLCGHGKWRSWLKREFDWEEKTAQRFMHTYEFAASGKIDKLSNLPISAIYLLAEPSTPVAAQQEIIDAVAAGGKLSVKQVQAVIEGHYEPKPKRAPKPKPQIPNLMPVRSSPTQEEMIEQIIDRFRQLDREAQRRCCKKLQNIFMGRA